MKRARGLALGASLAMALSLTGCGGEEWPEGCTVKLTPGADDQTTVQTALIEATSNSKVCLGSGTFEFDSELSLTVPRVTIAGNGPGRTILDFKGQTSGANAINVTADDFTIEELEIRDTPGDSVRVTADGVTFRRLKVWWTAGPRTENGAYALYPVQASRVIVEDCEVTGASDAGIYVGQSKKIIVRRNKVHGNVAGIEIENSQDAEVYQNEAFDNTAGILVFDLPNLPVRDGRRTRVYDNDVRDNNRTNFANPGGIVFSVPTGLGVVIMGTDEVEIHDNRISGNVSGGVVMAAYSDLPFGDPMDPLYDGYAETIWIHDNAFSNNGSDPKDTLTLPMVKPLEDILWTGTFDPAKDNSTGMYSICFMRNGNATFRNLDAMNDFDMMSTDPTPHQCEHPSLQPVSF